MSDEALTSLSLLQRAKVHDQLAWAKLVALYQPLVLHWCRRGGAQAAEGQDVAQEVFLAASNGLAEFERERAGSFRAWLRGITRHKLLDLYRRRERQPAVASGGTEAMQRIYDLPDPRAEEESQEVGGLYRRALELVRPEFETRTWDAFWRSAVEQHDTHAIAAELKMSPVAVRIAKSRVLSRLREEAGELIA
jgi:RNA polymerase sigma-70 factor (ECF subfamily)